MCSESVNCKYIQARQLLKMIHPNQLIDTKIVRASDLIDAKLTIKNDNFEHAYGCYACRKNEVFCLFWHLNHAAVMEIKQEQFFKTTSNFTCAM